MIDVARDLVLYLEEKFGEDIVLMDIHEQTYFSDYFVIATAGSERLLNSLSNDLVREIRTRYGIHSKAEGEASSGWMVIDMDDIIVHLFSPEQRDYYQLEELWSEGKVLLRVQ